MLRSVLLTSALALGLATPVLAQQAPAWNWTGAYAGLNGGFGGGNSKYPFSGTSVTSSGESDAVGANAVGGQFRQSTSGALGGVQIGYNYEMPNGWLVGLETDIDASDIGGRADFYGQDSLGNGYSGAVKSKIDYLGTVRARVGQAMFGGRFLPYVTGGFAYGGVKTSAGYACAACVGGGSAGTGFSTPTQGVTGWTAGAGAEYAMTSHLSFKVEYLYADFGTRTVDIGSGEFTGPGVNLYNASVLEKNDANVVRVGFNYRF